MDADRLTEPERMRRENARRDASIPADFYALSRPSNLFIRQGQERATLELLRRTGHVPFEARRVLDVGCGEGSWLRTFRGWGAAPDRLAGVDLESGRVEKAKQEFPLADLRAADATKLPWPNGHFDVVTQFTVFTSVLAPEARRGIASEMARVLAPGGVVLWYDFRYNNPRNPNVRGIGLPELRALFPGFELLAEKVTLAPPLARRVVPWSWTVATLLERLTVLNTHYAVALRRS